MTDIIGPSQPESAYPRKLLYPLAVQNLRSFQHQVPDKVLELVSVRWRDEFHNKAQGVVDQLSPRFTNKRIACEVGEVDQMSFEFIGIHDEVFLRIDCELFADGSPFVYDEDIDRLEAYGSPIYTVLSTPEFPPFLVFAATLDNPQTPGVKHGDVRSFVDDLRARGKQPRFLSEIAQQSVVRALAQAELDPKKCAEECQNTPELPDYFPR